MSIIGIIGAMSLEVEMLIKSMTVKEKKECAGNMYYIGELFDKEIVVTSCGVGKVNAASSTQILISEFKVDCIINTGIAGGMHSAVEVCDLVISKDVTHHDVRPEQMKSCYPYQEYFESDSTLIRVAVEAIEKEKIINGNYHIGRIVSGESFIDNLELKEQITNAFNPHCVEMEGSAIGHVAYINKIPFVVIRSISDNADNEATLSYDEFERIAAEQSSRIVINIIEKL